MPRVLVTGSSRGIGLEFCRQYGADGWQVIATCRTPATADQLAALDGDIVIHQLDVGDVNGIETLARALSGTAIDHLILNAGINLQTRVALDDVDCALWLEEMRINSIMPFATARCFIDHVAASERKLIAAIGSGAGNLARMTTGGHYPYRASKAALHAVIRILSHDLADQGITAVAITPGHTQTDMGGPSAPYGLTDSVTRMREALLRLGIEDSGRMLTRDGDDLPG